MINIDPGCCLKFKFLNMPVCCPHVFIHQQTQRKRYSMKSADSALYEYPAAKYLVFEIRQDLCILSYERIDHADQGEHIACHSRICESKFRIYICLPGTQRLQKAPQFAHSLKKCAFMHLVLDKCGQAFFFLY